MSSNDLTLFLLGVTLCTSSLQCLAVLATQHRYAVSAWPSAVPGSLNPILQLQQCVTVECHLIGIWQFLEYHYICLLSTSCSTVSVAHHGYTPLQHTTACVTSGRIIPMPADHIMQFLSMVQCTLCLFTYVHTTCFFSAPGISEYVCVCLKSCHAISSACHECTQSLKLSENSKHLSSCNVSYQHFPQCHCNMYLRQYHSTHKNVFYLFICGFLKPTLKKRSCLTIDSHLCFLSGNSMAQECGLLVLPLRMLL